MDSLSIVACDPIFVLEFAGVVPAASVREPSPADLFSEGLLVYLPEILFHELFGENFTGHDSSKNSGENYYL